MATAPKAKVLQPDADDDLDELDDVLSEFHDNSPSAKHRQPVSSGRPRHNTRVDGPGPASSGLGAANGLDEDDFARELAKGMEELMQELSVIDPNDSKDTSEEDVEKRNDALRRAWEAMFMEEMSKESAADGSGLPTTTKGEDSSAEGNTSPSSNVGEKDGFQKAMRQVMDKMKQSESNSQADPRSGEAKETQPENLEELLASLRDTDDVDETELAGFIENMMGQLLSKQVLYEPLKELSDKFPDYLASPPSPIKPEDVRRYEQQQIYIRKVLAIFEAPGYDDKNAEAHKEIVELMSEIQSYGSPPAELMGPLPSGLMGSDEILGEGCVVA
ncbi:hypothetical protein APHAL10511_004034 [Amanita phalloides]|nr:hypothetical protein APHAL10511_004034 [Amanita phalloides]